MTQFTTDQFDTEVLGNSKPVLVDFYADWCGPCKMLSPTIAALATAYEGKIVVGKVNVDSDPAIAERYNVMSIPTLIVFKGGEVVWQHVGLLPRAALEDQLNSLAE